MTAEINRVDAVDFARGAALVGMAAYHLVWDLADFRLAPPDAPFSPAMRLLSHAVAIAFLAIVGVSLALAHKDRLDLPRFWRRIATVAGAAALVTAGSYLFASGQLIWFGILHCIAVSSVFALPFIRARAWATFLVAAAAIAAPSLVHASAFDWPGLQWIGLGDALPNTLDWRPLLPWGGFVFLGLAVARLPWALPWLMRPERWRAKSRPAAFLCFAGRHSLLVYLVHQPILIGLVAAVAHAGFAPAVPDAAGFLAACQRACVSNGGGTEECDASCRCAADVISRSGAADRMAGSLDAARQAQLKLMIKACLAR